ncbi:olfactory receptor 4D6-like [Parambassis ranga]|uniref:Olfactory receptor n=1 Tax=Parambassis ranga TaxID=210632 RepID=A0A6P7HD40_9TELE|nr:olfactory receptor 4D6-like [Parambassis ranga]
MDDKFNGTYITIDGYEELHKYKYLYFLILFAVYVFVICSNSTIVYLIWFHQNLHEPMYIFIAALSVNSILFSTAVYPKFFIDILSERQIISYSACLFQFLMFYSLGASDFLLLSAMAYDRYVSICKPLQYTTIMRQTTVIIFLGLAWLVPACHLASMVALNANQKLCSFTLNGIFCNNSVYKLHCETSKVLSIYGVVVMIDVVFIPVVFILFTYTKILIITYKSSRDVRKKAAETCVPHLLVLFSFFCLSVYDVIIARLQFDFPKVVRLIMTLQIVLYNPLFNPIIYGLKMKEISKHLKRLVCNCNKREM